MSSGVVYEHVRPSAPAITQRAYYFRARRMHIYVDIRPVSINIDSVLHKEMPAITLARLMRHSPENETPTALL